MDPTTIDAVLADGDQLARIAGGLAEVAGYLLVVIGGAKLQPFLGDKRPWELLKSATRGLEAGVRRADPTRNDPPREPGEGKGNAILDED